MNSLTVIPAYGRDYATIAQAKAHWDESKDFQISDVGCSYNGAYVGKGQTAELKRAGYTHLRVRFSKLKNVDFIEL